MPNSDAVLETEALTIRFGGLVAVRDFSVRIPGGSIVGLIGPNGAGKTTCFNMVTGFYKPTEGKILFNGQDITGWSPHRVCSAGIARTFQNIRLFHTASVIQNVMVGARVRQSTTWWHALLNLPSFWKEERELREKALFLLDAVGLKKFADEESGGLPYGAQRRLELARALATDPTFLLLDEPAAGMNPNETQELMGFVKDIRTRFNLTILLIEHDMRVVMGICEHIWVLDYGVTIAEGRPEEIRSNRKVIEAYLGEEYVRDA
ncbi:MAG TPA: ABC transporter ATP-binding protein [Synergistales bacterium]|nr:ABC transporter ATP-binding protein [Synergistales bacterium]HPC75415.1 ABC transporter ATP-binding protein [Synergistales bacterium]HRS48148.1 ABC transporter ATP-binding protein [Thermovirgaceae bacterium]HRU90658.1 ABC transporter ATP-binding protein [Thermovirgaceae bacterium]